MIEARRDEGSIAYRHRIDAALDGGAGACLLARREIAGLVEAVLRRRDGMAYDLHAYVVMPNHVHALITQRDSHRLADIVQAWKSVSAKAINAKLGRTGRLWQREYHDRFMRDEGHFERTRAYIEMNPVIAGLASAPEEWPFSSGAKAWRSD